MVNTLDTPSAQRQFLVKVADIPDYFMTKSGGNVTADTIKVYNGGELQPDVLAGPAEVDNISLTRVFYRGRDNALLKRLRSQVSRLRTSVSVTPTDDDLIADGEPTVYPDALLIGFTELEVDASSGEAATYQLDFACGSVK